MSVIMQINPFDFFTDTNGDALDSGYIWIGEPNKDPRQYPVVAYYDAALTIPAAMPLRTSNGYIVRNGSPTFLYIDGNYSIRVEDKKHRQVFYVADFLLIGSGQAISFADLANNTNPALGAGLIGINGTDARSYLIGSRISTVEYGVPVGGVSAVAKLQELIDKEVPIYIDGTHLIDKSLILKNTDMIGPGKLVIVCDSNFQVTESSFVFADAAIAMPSGLSQFKINLQFKVEFSNSDVTKPHTPFRFIGLYDSVVNLDCISTGSGNVAQTNSLDFYFYNNRVKILGRYIINQRVVGSSAGLFSIRDVFLGSDPSRITTDVVVNPGTYIFNDGADEALSIYVTSTGGTFRGCGVIGSIIEGYKIGFSVLDLTAVGAQPAANVQAFATDTTVRVNFLGQGQAVVKSQKTNPSFKNVQAFINGIDDVTAGATFACGFRNAGVRGDELFPMLIGCKVYLNLSSQPARQIRAFDNPMLLSLCEYWSVNTANFTKGVLSDGRGSVVGGTYKGSLTTDVENVQSVSGCVPSNPLNVTFLSSRIRKNRSSVTSDGSGFFQIAHGMNSTPNVVIMNLENRPLRFIQARTPASDANFIYGALYTLAGVAQPGESVPVQWYVSE